MSRPNGPPNQPPAWPTSRPPQQSQPGEAPLGQGYDAYDPYYTQAPAPQPVHQPAPPVQPRAPAHSAYPPAQHPMASQPVAPSPRQPRIQTPAAPSARSPQHGLPPSAYAPPSSQVPQQQAYVPPAQSQPQASTQGYAAPTYAAPYPGQTDPRFTAPAPYDAPPQAFRQPPQQPTYNPGPSFDATTQGGYAQSPSGRQAATQPPAWQAPGINDYDTQGFNLDSYAPAQNAPRPSDLTATPRTAPPSWTPSPAEGYGDPRTQPTRPPQRDVPNFADAPTFAPQGYAQPTQAQAVEPTHDDAEYDDTLEEEAPRRRWGLIAASLVGAIALGGGLAYAYKAFVAPPAQVAGTPTVKAGQSPVKVKPADPGGTKFANTDSKMMESLSGSQSTTSESGTRAVQTMTISRDGSIASGGPSTPPGPPVAATQTPQAAAASVATATPVPGMTLVLPPNSVGQGAAGQRPQAQAPSLPQAAPVPPKVVTPKVIAAAPPAATDAIDAAAAAVKKAVPVKKTAPAALGAPVTGTSGFVAVLASVPVSGSSRVAAMQQYADLQQKFAGPLANKAPDVVEATTDKGAYHRLVVGPPASREAATSVCTQLKAAGYTKDCWVTAF